MVALLCETMALLPASPVLAQVGSVASTPVGPMELPIEVEIELSPAGSLKQAPLWKEIYQHLKNPQAFACPVDDPATLENESYFCTSTIQRREGFGVAMPPLRAFSPGYNFLTAQPMRRRTSDGEVSWDQPGPMFDPAEPVPMNAFNTPTALRTPIGHLVACPNPGPEGAYQAATVPATFCDGKPDGSLVVFNNTNSDVIPPNGTVVAVSAFVNGVLIDEAGDPITELEAPVSEEDFYRNPADTTGVPAALLPYIGRRGAELLGKALFWDMQLGSDGVQSCGTCHFNAGVDSRTKGQLNPNVLGDGNPSNFILTVKPANTDVVATDFPFHKGAQDSLATDSDDVMSSMGVSRFKLFNDIPPIGIANFLPAVNGVRALAPDLGTAASDPVVANEGLRRVEPRNTPTMHGAAYNFDNFWDGRARFIYNGGSVFGAADPTAHIFINPGLAIAGAGVFKGATMGDLRPDLIEEEPEVAEQPVRIKFASLASQAAGPPLSDFEMSFAGRNWAKIGKKLLQGDNGVGFGNGAPQQAGTNRVNAVVPLANQLVDTTDSRLGPFSNQGGSMCTTLGRPVAAGKPGLCISYGDMVRLAYERQYWNRENRHLNGIAAVCTSAVNGVLTPAGCDPFDGYRLVVATGPANPTNRDQFSHMEANFTMFFGLAVQAYESLLIPDNTLADQFFDANPNAGHAVGEPGDQAVLYPTLIPRLVSTGSLTSTGPIVPPTCPAGTTPSGVLCLPTGFGPDQVFGFDLFAGSNLTAALAPDTVDPVSGRNRNPTVTNTLGQTINVGSNPFTRSAKCMLCHLGPEQTDHSINISHGLLKNDAEFEYPTPPRVPDPNTPPAFADGFLPAPEPSGSSRAVLGLILEEEVGEGVAQDAVEVEPRDFAVFDDPATPWDDRIMAQESNFGFGDQGVYNIGIRPIGDDIGRGGKDAFGWPLSLSSLTLKNIGGQGFEPCRGVDGETCTMANFDPANITAEGAPLTQQGFEETGDGMEYPGAPGYTLQSINPGYERDPRNPQMPAHMAPWIHSLPAGELHPQIDEMAGMVPNTITAPNGGPAIEYPEVIFGADFHCASYDPALFGMGPPNFGWGPPGSTERLCPQLQSGVAGNFAFPSQGTWPVPNRVMGDGAFKAPALRNVELTGPYFHTGSFLTLRQVVDFYFRGGDFPATNKRSRDPHIVNLEFQAFAFGPTKGVPGGFDPLSLFDCSTAAPNDPLYIPVAGGCGSFDYLVGSFGDGLPDPQFLYDEYPDSDHPITPEPAFASRTAAMEDAKNALVKFLLSLTDPRVKRNQAPFDQPEIFVPIDGAAPENTGGRTQLVSLNGVACPVPGPNSSGACFRQVPAVGAAGLVTPLSAFLGVTSIPPTDPTFNCSMSAGAISHFCSTVLP
jgi:cytochrome c peroxidase